MTMPWEGFTILMKSANVSGSFSAKVSIREIVVWEIMIFPLWYDFIVPALVDPERANSWGISLFIVGYWVLHEAYIEKYISTDVTVNGDCPDQNNNIVTVLITAQFGWLAEASYWVAFKS